MTIEEVAAALVHVAEETERIKHDGKPCRGCRMKLLASLSATLGLPGPVPFTIAIHQVTPPVRIPQPGQN